MACVGKQFKKSRVREARGYLCVQNAWAYRAGLQLVPKDILSFVSSITSGPPILTTNNRRSNWVLLLIIIILDS